MQVAVWRHVGWTGRLAPIGGIEDQDDEPLLHVPMASRGLSDPSFSSRVAQVFEEAYGLSLGKLRSESTANSCQDLAGHLSSAEGW